MKVECYIKNPIKRIKHLIESTFKSSSIIPRQNYGTTLPPFAGFRLDVASKIMQIDDWRSKYGR